MESATKTTVFRWLRWIAALGGLLVFAVLLLADRFEICTVETVTGGDGDIVTQTCERPTVTDASVLAVGLLTVLLLAPDMSEVGVFGISLKRRLEAAEKKADASEAKTDRLETQLQVQSLRFDSLTNNVSAAAAQGIGSLYIMTGEKLADVDSDLREKASSFRWEPSDKAERVTRPPSTESRPDSALVYQIMENWEILSASLQFPPYRPGREMVEFVPKVPLTDEQISRFRTVFAEELQLVRAARNTAVHFAPISNNELQKAVEISKQLLQVLRNSPGAA